MRISGNMLPLFTVADKEGVQEGAGEGSVQSKPPLEFKLLHFHENVGRMIKSIPPF